MGNQYNQLTLEERVEIYRLRADGKSQRAIGACLGRPAATICRELRRNSLATKPWPGGYAPGRAIKAYSAGRRIPLKRRFAVSAPTITKGRWESEPMSYDSAAGRSPKMATSMIIMTGRSQRTAPSTTASIKLLPRPVADDTN